MNTITSSICPSSYHILSHLGGTGITTTIRPSFQNLQAIATASPRSIIKSSKEGCPWVTQHRWVLSIRREVTHHPSLRCDAIPTPKVQLSRLIIRSPCSSRVSVMSAASASTKARGISERIVEPFMSRSSSVGEGIS